MFFQKRKKLSTVDVLTLNFVAKVTIHPLIMCSSSSFFGTFFKYSYGFDDLSMHTDLELELDLSRSPPWSMLLEGCDVGSTFTAVSNCVLTGFRPMWLACQKKSYLMCDEITNFWIFTQHILNSFLKYKTETAKQVRDSCFKKINIT